MSGVDKLNQSLDDIVKVGRENNMKHRRGQGARRSAAGRPAASGGPVGGVQKTTKQAKQSRAVAATPGPVASGENRIMISNLPLDINEEQIKEFFIGQPDIGKPKKVLVQYGPTGRSLGSATVIFYRSEHAVLATKTLNNTKVDQRPLRVEMLVSAANVPAPAARPSLADRVSQPKKDKPKPATATKAAPAPAGRGRGGRARGGGRGGRGGRERGKKKTVEELDAEMADYFPPAVDGSNDAMVTNGADGVQATAGGDTAMDDEML